MEAIKIQYSRDNILNRKCEYLQNCITRLVVNEEDWERKERERREGETEKEEARRLEEFKKEKMTIHQVLPARLRERERGVTHHQLLYTGQVIPARRRWNYKLQQQQLYIQT